MSEQRNIDVNQVENGYEITIRQPSKGEMYVDPYRIVAKTKAEIVQVFSMWADGEDKPSIETNKE